MTLSNYIINDIKPISVESNMGELQQLFNQLTYSHIPIQNESGVFIGSFFETDAHCFEGDKPIKEFLYSLEDFYVRDTTPWLDILEAFAVNNANIMPVLNGHNDYLGYYELNDIIGLFSESPFFSEAGGILVVEKGINDYSFSEISQIVESNDGKLLGAFISHMNTDLVQITLKIGQTTLSDIIQTFRRYSYIIVSDHDEDSYVESLKERSNYLKKYLDI
ncbi:acetoin utilization protein acuB [Gaetbulibacter sp. M240]|uniref:CBS domain-containing protein n=1 Tax=Gaetbulibacter sp. M240 TaxID=3126511 RepID=UPI00374F3A2F